MPKRMSVDSPRVKKAQFAKLKLVILELMSVKPYIMADVDEDTRREMKASMAGSIEKLQALIRWVDSCSAPKPVGPRKGSPKSPISMGSLAGAPKHAEPDVDEDEDEEEEADA